jgi:hypothetical protein
LKISFSLNKECSETKGVRSKIANAELVIDKKLSISSGPSLDFNDVFKNVPMVSTAVAQMCCNFVLI